MTKLFTVVGTAVLNGQQKFRVANGTAAARTAVLLRAGAEDIRLIDLETPMNKDAAIEFFQNQSTGKKRNEKLENLTKRAKAEKAKTAKKTEVPEFEVTTPVEPKFEDVNSLTLAIESEILEPARGAKFNYDTRQFEDETAA